MVASIVVQTSYMLAKQVQDVPTVRKQSPGQLNWHRVLGRMEGI